MSIALYKTDSWTSKLHEDRLGYLEATRLDKVRQMGHASFLLLLYRWGLFPG